MPRKLTVSVVIPVYNEVDTLSACLDALLEQAVDILEVIIVDNNSTDGSLTVAGRYAAIYPQIKVVTEKLQGLVPARNCGFMEASGDIVARIDADTRVCPDWAAVISRFFGKHPAVAGITGQTRYYDLPFERFTTQVSHVIVDVINGAIASSACLYGPNMALRTDQAKLLATESCDEGGRLNEDVDLTLHLVGRGQKIELVPSMLVYISGRRLKAAPNNFVPYCLNWPRTYRLHRRYFAAATAYFISMFYCLAIALLFPLLRAYDHEELRFSWRRMMSFEGDRVIP